MSLLEHPDAQALLADAVVTPDQVRGCRFFDGLDGCHSEETPRPRLPRWREESGAYSERFGLLMDEPLLLQGHDAEPHGRKSTTDGYALRAVRPRPTSRKRRTRKAALRHLELGFGSSAGLRLLFVAAPTERIPP